MAQARSTRDVRSTRDALLDAAYDVVVAGNWQNARMLDVARAAGVSRQTLNNEFGSKDALAEALALREAQRFLDGITAALDESHPSAPAETVRTATEYTLREAANNPLLKAVLTDDASELLPFLTTRSEQILSASRAQIEDYWQQHWPELPTDDVELATELVPRLTMSYLLLPSDGPDASAQAIAARLAQLVDRILLKGQS
jgi:AcrR family transcriptional regulator